MRSDKMPPSLHGLGEKSSFEGLTCLNLYTASNDTTVQASRLTDLTLPREPCGSMLETGPAMSTWWLDALNPSKEDIKALAKAYSIHPLTCEAIQAEDAPEKLEIFETYYSVCFRALNHEATTKDSLWVRFKPVNIYLIVLHHGLISFSFQPSPHPANVRERIRTLGNRDFLSSPWICYALIDDITDDFASTTHTLEQQTCSIEETSSTTRPSETSTTISRIHSHRKQALDAMRLVRGKAGVLKSLTRHCHATHRGPALHAMQLALGDVQDHIVTIGARLEHCEAVLARARVDLLAQLSVDRVEVGNRTLRVIIRITVVAAIVVPLHVICALFGSNVQVPGGDGESLDWWFGILGVVVFLFVAGLTVARKMGLV